MKREPVFALQGWYPADYRDAMAKLQSFVRTDRTPSAALGVVVPHAGWVYSGATAGKLYAEVEIPGRVIVLCPSHRGRGANIAVWASGSWETPIGEVPVDRDFAAALCQKDLRAKPDFEAHLTEHAIEIQLPFLLYRNPKVRIVPIRLGHLRYPEAAVFAQNLADLILEAPGETLLVASSDMSHEPNPDRVATNDRIARDRLLQLDALGLMDAVEEQDITMCGYLPAAVVMETAKRLGARTAREVAYTNSAEISGRTDYVVGYCAVRFDR